MRVKMKESMPVTIDGVHTIDAEAGESYEIGDAVAADLIDKGLADDAEGAPAKPSRGGRGGKKKPADAETETQADDAEGAPNENAADETADETKE